MMPEAGFRMSSPTAKMVSPAGFCFVAAGDETLPASA
jgi:hypothetical protein